LRFDKLISKFETFITTWFGIVVRRRQGLGRGLMPETRWLRRRSLRVQMNRGVRSSVSAIQVVVVAGDREAGGLIARALRGAGYTVVHFETCDEALAYVDGCTRPVVLLLGSLRYLTANRVRVDQWRSSGRARLIVATGVQPELRPRGVRVLAKPFDVDQLIAAVEDAG
jgi:CheY-like chemotaxis protein